MNCFAVGLINRLGATQRAIERAMLGVSLRNLSRSKEIHRRTVAQVISLIKFAIE